jgi:hypothetical protein
MLQSRMLGGVSTGEIALTVLLLVIVIVAPKVGRVGEAVGGLFERGKPDPRK